MDCKKRTYEFMILQKISQLQYQIQKQQNIHYFARSRKSGLNPVCAMVTHVAD